MYEQEANRELELLNGARTVPAAQTRSRKEGRGGKEGRKGRKEEGKERASGAQRSGPVALMMDERVSWTSVLPVCFIDRTW